MPPIETEVDSQERAAQRGCARAALVVFAIGAACVLAAFALRNASPEWSSRSAILGIVAVPLLGVVGMILGWAARSWLLVALNLAPPLAVLAALMLWR